MGGALHSFGLRINEQTELENSIKMKKLMSLMVALGLVLGASSTTFAQDEKKDDGKEKKMKKKAKKKKAEEGEKKQ